MRFATEIVGLQLVRRDSHRAYLRASAGRDHDVMYVRGDASAQALSFDLGWPSALDLAVTMLARSGCVLREATHVECDERLVDAMFSLTDPTGNRLELVCGGPGSTSCALARDAGITAFSHVGLRTSDAPRDERFWTTQFGARVSDWIGEVPLLRLDEVHHRIALFPSQRPGVQHVNFQVGSLDDVMRAYYFLRERGVRIVFGPGRHPTSSAMFLYFEGPDDVIYEYSTGVRLITDEDGYVPRRFPFAPSSFCMWGSRPDIAEFRAAEPMAEKASGT